MVTQALFFLGVFLVVSAPMLGILAGVLWNRRQSQKVRLWCRTHGDIEHSDVRIESSEGGFPPDRYFTQVRYSYVVRDTILHNDEIWLNSQHEMRSMEEAQELAARYPVGRNVVVFYNPDNPAQAVLDPGFDIQAYRPSLGKALYFALLPALLFFILIMAFVASCFK
jgi:hypothetical protein